MPNMINVYLGALQQPKPDWKDILGDPKKPANWKDDTYQQKKAELQMKQMEGAAQHLAAGMPFEVCFLMEVDESLKVIKGNSRAVLDALTAMINTSSGTLCQIIGIETLALLRQMAWTAAADGKGVPSWIWNTSDVPKVINLYSSSGAKNDTDMPVESFIDYWLNMPCNNALILKVEANGAIQHAYNVYRVAKRMGF